MVLLFQAALTNIRRGAAALEAQHPEEANAPLTKACDIVLELNKTLDPSKAPELCGQLAAIYQFVCWRLTSANVSKDPELAREAERAFAPIAEAFAQAIDKVSSSRQPQVVR
jgi:flagellar protein FliS